MSVLEHLCVINIKKDIILICFILIPLLSLIGVCARKSVCNKHYKRHYINMFCFHSYSRCSKIIPLAESAYQQDLPPFYVTAYHLSKVNALLNTYLKFTFLSYINKFLFKKSLVVIYNFFLFNFLKDTIRQKYI